MLHRKLFNVKHDFYCPLKGGNNFLHSASILLHSMQFVNPMAQIICIILTSFDADRGWKGVIAPFPRTCPRREREIVCARRGECGERVFAPQSLSAIAGRGENPHSRFVALRSNQAPFTKGCKENPHSTRHIIPRAIEPPLQKGVKKLYCRHGTV